MYPEVQTQQQFEFLIQTIESEISAAALMIIQDGYVRSLYSSKIREMANELAQKAARGEITWTQAAQEATQVRNQVMEKLRSITSPIGLAQAQRMKASGKTFNQLLDKKAAEVQAGARFDQLTASQQNKVYAAIVESAGKSNPDVNRRVALRSRAGGGLIVLSLAVSVYEIATAADKLDVAKREVAVTAASIWRQYGRWGAGRTGLWARCPGVCHPWRLRGGYAGGIWREHILVKSS